MPLTREAVPLLQGAARKLHEAVRCLYGAVAQRQEAGHGPLDLEILALAPPRFVPAFRAHRIFYSRLSVKASLDIICHTYHSIA